MILLCSDVTCPVAHSSKYLPSRYLHKVNSTLVTPFYNRVTGKRLGFFKAGKARGTCNVNRAAGIAAELLVAKPKAKCSETCFFAIILDISHLYATFICWYCKIYFANANITVM